MQTSSSGPTYLSVASTRFIPASQIQDIWIHEAFTGFEVRFYLAIIVEGEQDLVVVFPVSYTNKKPTDIRFLLMVHRRNCYRSAVFWRRFGAERKPAYMVLRIDVRNKSMLNGLLVLTFIAQSL